MLPAKPSFERNALNRITFGARESELAAIKQKGWGAWVEDQLNPPAGDEPDLVEHIDRLALIIEYGTQPPFGGNPGWPAVKQNRQMNYLKADLTTLWGLARRSAISVAPIELRRIQQELNAVTWVRQAHARFQIREFMVDFWNNHFSIGRQEDLFSAASLPDFDARAIRPNALGNFRQLLEAVAKSPAMLKFLNNADSTADHPNENYARELLELHTMGAPAYQGFARRKAAPVKIKKLAVTAGFTDDDIIQASRALSGWTVQQGQKGPDGTLPFTGGYVFNPLQHNTQAGMFMGLDLATLEGEAQGQLILDVVACHPATADFVVRKLARRIFGDRPPATVVKRGTAAWLANLDAPDQLKHVLRAMVGRGSEIGAAPSKVRRPHERMMALLRTTETHVMAYDRASTALAPLGDAMFVWPTPEGRPDSDAPWLTAAANLEVWNQMLRVLFEPCFRTTMTTQMPENVPKTAPEIVSYWVNRMVGYTLRPSAMRALIEDAQTSTGAQAAFDSGGITNIERALRRMAALIAASPEFALR